MNLRPLLVLALLVVSGACERYDASRDEALKQNLTAMRGAITRFHADNGRYPPSLDALVPKYLPAIPSDPFTESSETWRVTTEETVVPNSDFQTGTVAVPESVVLEVHSAAPGADRNGVLYSEY